MSPQFTNLIVELLSPASVIFIILIKFVYDLFRQMQSTNQIIGIIYKYLSQQNVCNINFTCARLNAFTIMIFHIVLSKGGSSCLAEDLC